jgi:hypothetical protein
MREQVRDQVRRNEPHAYATREDFSKVFHKDMNGLYQLSFLLAGDHEKAEKCFVAGIEDSVNENRVFREWARSWAKRIIVENAIRELKPRPSHGSPSSATVFSQTSNQAMQGGISSYQAVILFPENYSDHECAPSRLLGLGDQIRQARVHAFEELASSCQVVSFAP